MTNLNGIRLACISLILMMLSCNNGESEYFIVTGNLQHASGKKLLLAELPYAVADRIVVDSARIDSSGNFHLQANTSQEKMYQLFLEDGPSMLFINDSKRISLTADVDSIEGFTVSGSPASAFIKDAYDGFYPLYIEWQRQEEEIKQMPQKGLTDSMAQVMQTRLLQSKKHVDDFLKAKIAEAKNGTAVYFMLGLARSFLSSGEFRAELEKSRSRFNDHPGIAWLQIQSH